MESNGIELAVKHETGKKSYDKIFKKKSVTEKPKKKELSEEEQAEKLFFARR